MNNKLFLSLLAYLLAVTPAKAQSRQGTLQLQLKDGQPLTIVLDGRHFRKYGTILTVGDIPEGMHELKAYYYYPAGPDSRRGRDRAVLVYKGRMRIDGSRTYYCVIDPSDRSLHVRESRIVSVDERNRAYPIEGNADFSDGRNDESWEYDKGRNDQSSQVSYYNERNRISAAEMALLKSAVDDKIGAADKVRTITLYLEDKTLMTDQVLAILGWLNFESSRLEVATFCYPRVSDPDNYLLVSNKLAFQSSKRELEKEMLRIRQEGAGTVAPSGNTASANSSRTQLSEKQMTALLASCNEKVSDSEKMKWLQSGLSQKSMTVAQLNSILKCLLFEGSRLELVKWSYPRLSDPQQVGTLKPSFSYTSSKNEIDRLGSK